MRGCVIPQYASIGVAVYPDDGESATDIMRHADRAMYEAKKQGKNSYKFFSQEMNNHALRRLTMESELRKAVDNDQIDIHYQPKVDLVTGEMNGAEALARWNFDGEAIAPDVFIAIAEESGLILPLGEFILTKACYQYKSWIDKGLASGKLAVNISARQFMVDDLVQTVAAVLDGSGLSAKFLELEITETTVIQDAEKAVAQMYALRELGVSLAIDDFGTGYSSLNYLKRFPINTLKIDRSFVKDMNSSQQNRNIVQLIIRIAHTLGLKIVAEGVETKDQAEMIKDFKAEDMQGYLYSRPVNAQEFEEMLRKSPNLYESQSD